MDKEEFERLKNEIFLFKRTHLKDSDSAFHHDAEIWAGFKELIVWIESRIVDKCDWCGSINITDPVQGLSNGFCNDCGSHW